jgi:arginine/lysine/ornithine decarboxylase
LQKLFQPQQRPLALHLPAHGGGRGLAPALVKLLRQRPGSWDIPELPQWGGPLLAEGAVAAAQQRCAALLGADRCWFGVNGASGLLQAALLALAAPGQRVLLPRNLHRSLLHGCLLGQLRPVLYELPFDPATGLWLPPTAAQLRHLIADARQVEPLAAVVVVSPSYQGLAYHYGQVDSALQGFACAGSSACTRQGFVTEHHESIWGIGLERKPACYPPQADEWTWPPAADLQWDLLRVTFQEAMMA